MNYLIRLSIMLITGTLISFADTTDGSSFELINKFGANSSYMLETNEFAVIRKSQSTTENNLIKQVAEHPSYKLFSVKENKIKVDTLEKIKDESMNAGKVFYKNGNKDEDHRYISTGEIIVVFATKQNVNLEEFAAQYKLKYIKPIGPSELQTALFTNQSTRNDVELSSTLTKSPLVKSAKPNWILPLKLF